MLVQTLYDTGSAPLNSRWWAPDREQIPIRLGQILHRAGLRPMLQLPMRVRFHHRAANIQKSSTYSMYEGRRKKPGELVLARTFRRFS